jgi:hypothetical protein
MLGGQSFAARTLVLLAGGKAEPVSKLKVGQRVLAMNPRTGRDQAETVTAVLVHHDTDLYDLKIRAGCRTSVISTTSSHLFFVPGTGGHGGGWVKAGSLRYGTHLRTPGGRDTAVVSGGWVPPQRDGWMWDLTVPGNDDHDFYIDTEAADVLVHNVDESKVCDLTLGPGANARDGVGLVDGDINGPGVRDMINESGDANGCHTCGDMDPGTKSGNWIPDHQPPTRLVEPGTPQTAYPQCVACARQQGGIVNGLLNEWIGGDG